MLPSLPSHHDFQWRSALVHLGTRLDNKVPSFSWTTLQGSCSLENQIAPGLHQDPSVGPAMDQGRLANGIRSLREQMEKQALEREGLKWSVSQMPLSRGRRMGERFQRKV